MSLADRETFLLTFTFTSVYKMAYFYRYSDWKNIKITKFYKYGNDF